MDPSTRCITAKTIKKKKQFTVKYKNKLVKNTLLQIQLSIFIPSLPTSLCFTKHHSIAYIHRKCRSRKNDRQIWIHPTPKHHLGDKQHQILHAYNYNKFYIHLLTLFGCTSIINRNIITLILEIVYSFAVRGQLTLLRPVGRISCSVHVRMSLSIHYFIAAHDSGYKYFSHI